MSNKTDEPPAQTKAQPTEAQQIDALKQRVTTLEGQVLNCLKFMAYQAEQQVKELDKGQGWTPLARTKAEA